MVFATNDVERVRLSSTSVRWASVHRWGPTAFPARLTTAPTPSRASASIVPAAGPPRAAGPHAAATLPPSLLQGGNERGPNQPAPPPAHDTPTRHENLPGWL